MPWPLPNWPKPSRKKAITGSILTATSRGLFFLLVLLFPSPVAAVDPPAATAPMAPKNDIRFTDDLDYHLLHRAIRESIHYLRQQPATAEFPLGTRCCTTRHLIRSLVFFDRLIASRPSPQLLSLELTTFFDIYQAAGREHVTPAGTMLVTGYYQPVFQGSLVRTPPFLHPLYSIPGNLVVRHNHRDGSVQPGRFQGGLFTSYWSREEIEREGYARGSELVWLKDPFDAYLLHIQGSGLIRLRDGSLRGIHYAINNGRPYTSIGKYMVDTGKITLEEAGIDTIRQYLVDHPAELREILYTNQSFIFFQWTQGHDAIGNLDRPLTDGRSIAVDQGYFPAGGLAFLQSRKPVSSQNGEQGWMALNRFVLVQDTGSAIRGPGRVDLFWGTGRQAGAAAGKMKENGRLFFLLLKEQFL